MTHFRIQRHDSRPVNVVEVLDEHDNLLGVLYPQDHGIRLVSKYLDDDKVTMDRVVPMALEIMLP